MIDRNEIVQEIKLRDFIKRAIKVRAKNKKDSHIWEEFELRSIIRKLLKEADTDKTQHRSTGINVLEDLLKKIVPVLEQDYKMMTTNVEQRKSFAAHIVAATEKSLAPVSTNKEAGEEDEKFIGIDEIEDINEIEVEIGDKPEDNDAFIDIEDKEEEEEGNVEDLGDEDKTGLNFAQSTFDKIEKQIIDAFSLLSNEEDQSLFEEYLLTNLKLYFDKFESELDPDVAEPTTQSYEDEKEELEAEEGEEELEL
mgnify:CR=1 FL=1|tara:strand:+ start:1476 stop:2231 length:756 start_codon:yes stop_codon:yes gene_type:complete